MIRLIIAYILELGNDEVYYWTYALHLQSNYFDHPPMVGLLIRLSTLNLLINTSLFVRLGAIIASAIGTLLIYKIGTFINNERTGFYASLLYTSSLYCSIIAGTFILPDSPQIVFWLWSLLLLFKIKYAIEQRRNTVVLWCWFGLASGLCMMSKVHGIFLWVAIGLYASLIDRKWFLQGGMYVAVFISLIAISPIVIWNVQNDFITYTFHGDRVSINSGFDIISLFREVGGSIFYNNPINFFLIWISIFGIWNKCRSRSDMQLLLLAGLPLILILIGVSMFRTTFPHWSGPGYTALILLSAVYLDAKQNVDFSRIPALIKSSLVFISLIVVAGIGVIKYYPGTLSTATDNDLGSGDFTLDMYGWKKIGEQTDSLFKSDVKNQLMPSNARILVSKWFPAAHIDFYVASKTGRSTYAVGELFDLHHYHWLNEIIVFFFL